jgi:hypothetical protein
LIERSTDLHNHDQSFTGPAPPEAIVAKKADPKAANETQWRRLRNDFPQYDGEVFFAD